MGIRNNNANVNQVVVNIPNQTSDNKTSAPTEDTENMTSANWQNSTKEVALDFQCETTSLLFYVRVGNIVFVNPA